MNDNQDFGTAVGFVSSISIIFMMCYTFELSNSPFFLLLLSVMSFGYTLCLLAVYKTKKQKSFYSFLAVGIILIGLCLALSFTVPHDGNLFF